MYNGMKQTQDQNERLNEESQQLIAELEGENKQMKADKERL